MGVLWKNGIAKAVRRRKNFVFILLVVAFAYTAIQVIHMRDRYRALQPLYNAEAEAQRLLKFLTSYHYQCNSTVQVDNSSQFPLCMDKGIGLDTDSKEQKIAYSIGALWDYAFERTLALNLSVQVFIISHRSIPYVIEGMNNTHVIKTTIVPNDYADFARNSFRQQTINDLMSNLKHNKIDVLKIREITHDHEMWEMVHFMTTDNLLLNVNQLHFALYIDKIEDDALYNWYRTMYELYYQQGFRLYHTAAADSLCLQVTMMQSCLYYTSWVRIPSPTVPVLHPPADFGTQDLEEERLLEYLSTLQEDCGDLVSADDVLHAVSHSESLSQSGGATWWLCHHRRYMPAKQQCVQITSVSRLRRKAGEKIQSSCTEYVIEPVEIYSQPLKSFSFIRRKKKRRFSWDDSQTVSSEEMIRMLRDAGAVSVLEVSFPGHEWQILQLLLDSGLLQNVTQLLLEVQLPDRVHGKHPSVYRHHYSLLRRLQMQHFQLFHTMPLSPTLHYKSHQDATLLEDCCFRLGFIKKETKLQ